MYQNPWVLRDLIHDQQHHISRRAASVPPEGRWQASPFLRWRRALIFMGSWPAPPARPRSGRSPAASAPFRA